MKVKAKHLMNPNSSQEEPSKLQQDNRSLQEGASNSPVTTEKMPPPNLIPAVSSDFQSLDLLHHVFHFLIMVFSLRRCKQINTDLNFCIFPNGHYFLLGSDSANDYPCHLSSH